MTLVDLDLGGESGFDVAEQLHRVGSPTRSPVILISTHAAQDFAELIETSPAAGFMAKSDLSGERDPRSDPSLRRPWLRLPVSGSPGK